MDRTGLQLSHPRLISTNMVFTDSQQSAWMDFILRGRQVLVGKFDKNRMTPEIVHATCPIANDRLPNVESLAHQFHTPKTTMLRWLREYEARGWIIPLREGSRVLYVASPTARRLMGEGLDEIMIMAVKTLSESGVCHPTPPD